MQYLIIFSCGWVINHLVLIYCAAVAATTTDFFPFSLLLLVRSLHRIHRLSCKSSHSIFVCSIIFDVLANTLSLLSRCIRNHVYFCVWIFWYLLAIGFIFTAFRTVSVCCACTIAACQLNCIYAFVLDTVFVRIVSLKQSIQQSLSDWFIFLLAHAVYTNALYEETMGPAVLIFRSFRFTCNSLGLHRKRTKPSVFDHRIDFATSA